MNLGLEGSEVQRFKVQGFCVATGQKSGRAGLIGKETNEHPTSNVQHRTSNECILSVLKKDFAKRFHPSSLVLRHSIFCGSIFDSPAYDAGLFGRELWVERLRVERLTTEGFVAS